jgi:lipopolysaccharide transport system ATP-binding protein
MENEILVKVESVSKKFCRSLKRSLWYGVQDVGAELFGRAKKPVLRKNEFWAVDNISFELRRGDCLGLIGHNGAGKSTLLKMLNGLIKPDKGRITMKGRVGALIELGTGFNPILTGRENIYNNGAVLGFTQKEINEKFDSIVEFSEIGDFLDTPVQNYSSGMKVRLGFSVAVHMEPDIILIDEVLAVGDLRFKLKSFNLLDRLVEHCSVIFVSHSMQYVSRMCNQILLLENGCNKYLGENVSEGIDRYYQGIGGRHIDFILADSSLDILKVTINNSEEEIPLIKRLDDLIITLHIEIRSMFEHAVSSINIFDHEQKSVGICISEDPINLIGEIVSRDQGKTKIVLNVKIPRINLSKGLYYITFILSEAPFSKPVARLNNVKAFQVTSKYDVWPPYELEGIWQRDGFSPTQSE